MNKKDVQGCTHIVTLLSIHKIIQGRYQGSKKFKYSFMKFIGTHYELRSVTEPQKGNK